MKNIAISCGKHKIGTSLRALLTTTLSQIELDNFEMDLCVEGRDSLLEGAHGAREHQQKYVVINQVGVIDYHFRVVHVTSANFTQ